MKKIILLLSIALTIYSCSNNSFEKNERVIIGTFNMEWLGDGENDRIKRSEKDYARLAEVIENTEADVIGLQEIENEAAIKKVMKYLPDYNYFIGETGYIQNPAVIFKKNVDVKFIENYEPLAVVPKKSRAGLVVSCKKGNFDWIMMVVHFKSTSRYDSTETMRLESFEMRKQQSLVLKNWADSVQKVGKEKDIIIVGDFNDNPKRTKTLNLAPLVEGNFNFLTADLESCANPNWDMIDHIAANKSALNRFLVNSLYVLNIRYAYTKSEIEKLSDHCPVVVAFDIITPDND